jgi:hypothetical protein
MPGKYLQALIKGFGSIKQQVIWKWDSQPPDIDLPSNIHMAKWLPQQDLLGNKYKQSFKFIL